MIGIENLAEVYLINRVANLQSMRHFFLISHEYVKNNLLVDYYYNKYSKKYYLCKSRTFLTFVKLTTN